MIVPDSLRECFTCVYVFSARLFNLCMLISFVNI